MTSCDWQATLPCCQSSGLFGNLEKIMQWSFLLVLADQVNWCTLAADLYIHTSHLNKFTRDCQSVQWGVHLWCYNCWFGLVLPSTHSCYCLCWLIFSFDHQGLYKLYVHCIECMDWVLLCLVLAFAFDDCIQWGRKAICVEKKTFAAIKGSESFKCLWRELAGKKTNL